MILWLLIFFSFIMNKYMRNLIKSNLMLAKNTGVSIPLNAYLLSDVTLL